MADRIIFIGTPIDDYIAGLVVDQLRQLVARDSRRYVSLYLNSPGGYIDASLRIVGEMDAQSVSVHTLCVGQAAGTALTLLAHGTRGHRLSLPNGRCVFTAISGPDSTALGPAQHRIVELLARDTGRDSERVRHDMQAQRALSAEEARQYGLIDAVIEAFPANERNGARAQGPGAQPIQ